MGTAILKAMDPCRMGMDAHSREGKYLTFSLAQEGYGIVIHTGVSKF